VSEDERVRAQPQSSLTLFEVALMQDSLEKRSLALQSRAHEASKNSALESQATKKRNFKAHASGYERRKSATSKGGMGDVLAAWAMFHASVSSRFEL
jgi:hypothetical protein